MVLRRESAFCPQWKLEDNKISLKPSRGIAKGCPRGSKIDTNTRVANRPKKGQKTHNQTLESAQEDGKITGGKSLFFPLFW